MLRAIALVFVAVSLQSTAFGQMRSGSVTTSAGGVDEDISEPADDEGVSPEDEDVPKELMSDDEPGGDSSTAELPNDSPANLGRTGSVEAAAQNAAMVASASAVAGTDYSQSTAPLAVDDKPSPEDKNSAVERVAEDCHVERGLFCDPVRADDLKAARCLLKYRDSVLPDCARALDQGQNFLR